MGEAEGCIGGVDAGVGAGTGMARNGTGEGAGTSTVTSKGARVRHKLGRAHGDKPRGKGEAQVGSRGGATAQVGS